MKTLIVAMLSVAALSASVTIPVTNTNWYFSPWTTASDGVGGSQSNNVNAGSTLTVWNGDGAYFKTVFTGTSATLNIVAPSAGNCATAWTVDNGPVQTSNITSGSTVALATGLAAGNHTLFFAFISQTSTADNWGSSGAPAQSLIITGLVLDNGATVNAPTGSVAVNTQTLLWFGDSITEYNPTDGYCTHNFPAIISNALTSEYGQVGWSSQGWSVAGTGNVPAFPNTWSFHFSGNSRLIASKLSPIPSAIFINEGTNDGATNIQAITVTTLTAIRAAVNTSTPVVIIQPFGQFQQANLQAAITTLTDPYIYYVNLGVPFSYGLTNSGASFTSPDGLHPSTITHANLSSAILSKIQNQIGGVLTSGAIVIAGANLLK